MLLNSKYKKIIDILKKGGVGVMQTDTLYGLVGRADSKKAVERIYKIKGRNKNKPLIILISDIKDLKKFRVKISDEELIFLEKVWPGKVSVILSGLAFRLPNKKPLIKILKKTGPLVAPSANLSGLKPAKNIKEAQEYFGDNVDFYLSGGTLKSRPSTLIGINKKGEIKVLRGMIKKHGKRKTYRVRSNIRC